MTGDLFQGGLLEAPLYPLKPGVSRGPPGLSGGPGPLRPLRNSTTGCCRSIRSLRRYCLTCRLSVVFPSYLSFFCPSACCPSCVSMIIWSTVQEFKTIRMKNFDNQFMKWLPIDFSVDPLQQKDVNGSYTAEKFSWETPWWASKFSTV